MTKKDISTAQAALNEARATEQTARERFLLDGAPAAQKELAAAVAARQKAERNLGDIQQAHARVTRQRIADLQAELEQHARSVASIRQDAARGLLESIDRQIQDRAVLAEAAACRTAIDAAAAEVGDEAPHHPSVTPLSFAMCELLHAEVATSPPDRQQAIMSAIRGIEPSWGRLQQLIGNAESRREYADARAAEVQ
jgi:hypothetical protein